MKTNELHAKISEFKLQLSSTDYHVIKASEGDYIVPEEIMQLRKSAREQINIIEDEILKQTNELPEFHMEILNTIENEESI